MCVLLCCISTLWIRRAEMSRFGWGGIWGEEVTISPSRCLSDSPSLRLSPQQKCSQCGVMGLGLQQQNPTQTHFITPTPSPSALLSNHPESLSMWHAANITSKAMLQKTGRTWLLCRGCTDWYGCARTQTHTHIAMHNANSHKKRTPKYKPIPLHTCPPHSKPLSHPFLFWVKEGTCTQNHTADDKKDTTDRGEREQLHCAYTKQPLEPHFPFFYFSRAKKGSFTFVLAKNVNVRFQ